MFLKKQFFILFLSCLMIVEMQAQAWITPIGTEVTDDEGFEGKICGLGSSFDNVTIMIRHLDRKVLRTEPEII